MLSQQLSGSVYVHYVVVFRSSCLHQGKLQTADDNSVLHVVSSVGAVFDNPHGLQADTRCVHICTHPSVIV